MPDPDLNPYKDPDLDPILMTKLDPDSKNNFRSTTVAGMTVVSGHGCDDFVHAFYDSDDAPNGFKSTNFRIAYLRWHRILAPF
jgi:hypothetical protein